MSRTAPSQHLEPDLSARVSASIASPTRLTLFRSSTGLPAGQHYPFPPVLEAAPHKLWVGAKGLGWPFRAAVRATSRLCHRPLHGPGELPALLSRAPSGPLPAEVLVLTGYHAQKDDELSVALGDVVRQVCKGPARGWLRGELGGQCGLFPEHLVQVRPSPRSEGLSSHSPDAQSPTPVPWFPENPGESALCGGGAQTALCARQR